MTAIERAWEAVDARDPTALHQCVDAMVLAHELLLEPTSADADEEPGQRGRGFVGRAAGRRG